jgi:hypothetical protein
MSIVLQFSCFLCEERRTEGKKKGLSSEGEGISFEGIPITGA